MQTHPNARGVSRQTSVDLAEEPSLGLGLRVEPLEDAPDQQGRRVALQARTQ